MDIIKYIYSPTTHGNYVISKVLMEPILNSTFSNVEFRLKRRIGGYSKARYRLVSKGRYSSDECFDTKADAIAYADNAILSYRKKIVDKLKQEQDIINEKIISLEKGTAKIAYLNFVEE